MVSHSTGYFGRQKYTLVTVAGRKTNSAENTDSYICRTRYLITVILLVIDLDTP